MRYSSIFAKLLGVKTVLSSVLIIFLAGLLNAQNGPPGSAELSADLSGAVATMQGSADLLLVSSIAEGIGLGFGTALVIATGNTRQTQVPLSLELSWVSIVAYAGLTPLGFIASSIAYGTLLDTYNGVNPNDKQYAAPYLLLTIGGAVVTSIGIVAYIATSSAIYESIGLTPSEASQQNRDIQTARNVLLGIGLVGLATSLSGIVVSVVHSQELLVKTKSTIKKAVTAPTQQIIVTPQIGIGSFGITISMP